MASVFQEGIKLSRRNFVVSADLRFRLPFHIISTCFMISAFNSREKHFLLLEWKSFLGCVACNNVDLPTYRCSLSDTTLDTMVLHSSLLVAVSAHLFMFIPAYRETFPSHPHLFLPRPCLPFTMPSVIIRCRLSCLLTCP